MCETKEQLEVVPLLPRWVHSLTPRRQWLLRPLDGRAEAESPQLRPFNARPKKSNAKERRTMRGEVEAR